MTSTNVAPALGGASSLPNLQADTVYRVRDGDTLSGIADAHGVTQQALLEDNPHVLHPDLIQTGQALHVPALTRKASVAEPFKPATGAQPPSIYTVRNGDTLTGIASKHGLDWRVLAQVNGVGDPTKLRAGATLSLNSARPTEAHRSPVQPTLPRTAQASAGAADAIQPASATSTAYTAANLQLGVNTRYLTAVNEAATLTGLPPQSVATIVDAEAARYRNGVWNADSYNAQSHAGGLTQFLPGTWRGEATRAGSILNAEARACGVVDENNRIVPGREQNLLDMRYDARVAILAAADYARGNVEGLRATADLPANADAGRTAQAAYLAHHEGLAGARNFLRGDMSRVSQRQFDTNVPTAQRQRYLDQSGGDRGQAYRQWLGDYVDQRIDTRRFMADPTGVPAPAVGGIGR